jgi:hypothetical protein
MAPKKKGAARFADNPFTVFYWSGRSDSNTRPLAPHAGTLDAVTRMGSNLQVAYR